MPDLLAIHAFPACDSLDFPQFFSPSEAEFVGLAILPMREGCHVCRRW
jgi:hypothetical protein